MNMWVDWGSSIIIYLDWYTAIAFAVALALGIYLALWLHDRRDK